MEDINIKVEIERLLMYALQENLIEELDLVLVRNRLLELLEIDEPYGEEINYQGDKSLQEILDNILDYAYEKGILAENTTTYRDLFDTKIMGLLMPKPSVIAKKFNQIAQEEGINQATDYYYHLSKASNYIRTDRIAKNLHWISETKHGEIEITINLSKPEKDPKAIAQAKKLKKRSYPKCFLCIDNVGYSGRLNHPARQSHRVIPINLDGEEWFLQYSPYVYYNEHSIIFSKNHSPMKVNRDSFSKLLNFVEQFPHYFLGSNADLPLVGGSILSHEHFQGGRHSFPMERAKLEIKLEHQDFPEIEIGIVDWPMSVVRLRSTKKEKLLVMADMIFKGWKTYNDVALDIIAYSKEGEDSIPHNTVTPIARQKEGVFELDLVLRNNRTNQEHPEGIFHPSRELHHIKKENIGLIEVMGLAILPGRLKVELEEVQEYLQGKEYNKKELSDDMLKHSLWIEELLEKYNNLDAIEAKKVIKEEVASKFSLVLEDAGVFKKDEEGRKGFVKFLSELNILQK